MTSEMRFADLQAQSSAANGEYQYSLTGQAQERRNFYRYDLNTSQVLSVVAGGTSGSVGCSLGP
jgi:hypothetical protein